MNNIKNTAQQILIIICSILFVTTISYAATTISSNISTDGTLSVTGATTLRGVAYTWPAADGSASTYLQTDGSGALSWATVSSGSSSDWTQETNYGTANLTASTTIPYWAKGAIYASSTLIVAGNTTLSTNSNTKVGIGTTSPYAKLSVTGFINTDQYSGYKQAGNTILYASSTNSSTLVGQGAGAAMLAAGTDNTAVGYEALNANTTGDNNTAVGRRAGLSNTTGLGNLYLGRNAGYYNTIGNSNVFVGRSTGYRESGGNNTFLGYGAGDSSGFLTRDGNVFIGYQAGYNETGSNKLYIANSQNDPPLIYGDFSVDRIGFGTTTPMVNFQVTATTTNATTTVEFGKANQNKGSCLKLYNEAGTLTYCTIVGTTLSCSITSCE